MSEVSGLSAALQARFGSRSIGLKLIVVCGLALVMMIPAAFVHGVISDRTERAADVVNDIGAQVGGRQTFLGPTLAIPYTVPPQGTGDATTYGVYLVFPAQASATVRTATEERRRSLFKVPVFRADLNLGGSFHLAGVPSDAPVGAVLDWAHAELIVGVSDPRGALADATLTANGKTVTMTPAEASPDLTLGGPGQQTRLTLFGAPADAIARPGSQFNVNATLHFSGAQRIALLAYGKTTHVSAEGEWPNPGFDGGFLPVSRTVTPSGYRAEWSVPFIARGVRAEGPSNAVTGLNATALGISFIEVADPYQSVDRSLKYVPLFLGLVFLSYFVFEVTAGRRVHPAQYLLVGVAQIIFYLLLLSVAEHIGFDWGFLLAGAATVALLSANAGWIFGSRMHSVKALLVFAPLYGLIYVMLRLEDNALLVGAIASFAAVAAAMYFTRSIDWYSSMPGGKPASAQPAGNPAESTEGIA